MADKPQAQRRPGGRSARVRDAIYTAVSQLVSEVGVESLSIPMIAERAEVNPTSVYRRWGDVDALVAEVATAALTSDAPLPDTGSARGDLMEWSQIIITDITRPERVIYLRAMVGARQGIGNGCPCTEVRTEQAAAMMERARVRGEVVPRAEQVLDHVIAPLYHHVAFGLPADIAYAHRLVDDVMAMAHARLGV